MVKELLPVFVLLAGTLLTAYSSGPASSNESSFTGAPSAGGGVEGTCGNCHFSGDYGTPRLTARLSDMEGNSYRPGQTYTVTVAVRPESGEAEGYGFQAQFLDHSDPILQTAGVLSDPDAATQIARLDNGRSIAEHKGPNRDSLFTFAWTAPEPGTGPVSLYVTGNLVNRADGSVGDNGSKEPLIVTFTEGEELSTSTAGFPNKPITGTAYPNPTTDQVTVPLDVPAAGRYRFDLIGPDGRQLRTSTRQLAPGPQTTTVDLQSRPAGLYHYRVSGPAVSETIRLQRQ